MLENDIIVFKIAKYESAHGPGRSLILEPIQSSLNSPAVTKEVTVEHEMSRPGFRPSGSMFPCSGPWWLSSPGVGTGKSPSHRRVSVRPSRSPYSKTFGLLKPRTSRPAYPACSCGALTPALRPVVPRRPESPELRYSRISNFAHVSVRHRTIRSPVTP